MPRQATAENEPSLAISRRTHRKSGSSQGTGEGADGGVEFGAGFGGGAVDEEDSLGVVEFVLDDIFGELDPVRRNALISHMPANAQKWITTTHLDWLKSTHSLGPIARFTIKAGTCSASPA